MFAVDDFLRDVFRDQAKRPCVVADFFSAKGRAVQLWNSTRYLEASCRLCKAISDKAIGEEEGMPCSGYFSHRQAGC